MTKPLIGFVLGSKSDLPVLEGAESFLQQVGVEYEVRVISAHRTPERARDYARSAKDRGLKAIVAVAGMAAHLGGVLAASTRVPVLGVPVQGSALAGLDALLSMVQMPGGVPVATFAVGKAGATNAAIFACQMMALTDERMAREIDGFRAAMRAQVEEADASVRDRPLTN